MQSSWLWALAAWLIPLSNLAWEKFVPGAYRGNAKLDRDAAFPWEDAADDELVLYAALITAAHY